MRQKLPLAAGLRLILLATGGCNLLASPMYALAADRTQKIQAEFEDLEGKDVCLWVWADESVSFSYPQVRLDVANHVRHAINQHINCTFTDPLAVHKFQRSDYEADRLPMVEIGRKFDADMVMHIQLLEFRTHPYGSDSLLQGHILAQCALYDCRGDLPVQSRDRELWSGRVEVDFPEKHPLNPTEADVFYVRSATIQVFSQALAKKFYTHREPVGG